MSKAAIGQRYMQEAARGVAAAIGQCDALGMYLLLDELRSCLVKEGPDTPEQFLETLGKYPCSDSDSLTVVVEPDPCLFINFMAAMLAMECRADYHRLLQKVCRAMDGMLPGKALERRCGIRSIGSRGIMRQHFYGYGPREDGGNWYKVECEEYGRSCLARMGVLYKPGPKKMPKGWASRHGADVPDAETAAMIWGEDARQEVEAISAVMQDDILKAHMRSLEILERRLKPRFLKED